MCDDDEFDEVTDAASTAADLDSLKQSDEEHSLSLPCEEQSILDCSVLVYAGDQLAESVAAEQANLEARKKSCTSGRCCNRCGETMRGFGDVCGSCRKVGPDGSVRQCNSC